MKRSVQFLAAVVFIITLFLTISSCKKYTCQCTAYSGNNPEPGSYGTFTVKGSAAKRKRDCNDHSTQPDAYGSYTQCVIK